MIAGRPSGIAATARPTAARNISLARSSRAPGCRTAKVRPRRAPGSRSSACGRSPPAGGAAAWSAARPRPSMPLIRPISVASPVATTTPRPLAVGDQRARERHGVPVAEHGIARRPAAGPSRPAPIRRSAPPPRRCRLRASTRRRSAGTRSPDSQQHDVARHQLLGGQHDPAPAVAQHRRLQRQHVADRLERPLGLALLDEADQRVDHDDAEDHAGIDPVRAAAR